MNLALIWTAGGIYDFQTLNRHNSKWPDVKIFSPRYIPHKKMFLNYTLWKVLKKNVLLGNFSIKK